MILFAPKYRMADYMGWAVMMQGAAWLLCLLLFLHFYCYMALGFNLCFAATAEEENGRREWYPDLFYHYWVTLNFAIVGELTLLQMAIAEKGNLVIDCL